MLAFPDGTSKETMLAAMRKRYGSPAPDFSNVQGGVSQSAQGYDRGAQYDGPLLEGDGPQGEAPSLNQINSQNRRFIEGLPREKVGGQPTLSSLITGGTRAGNIDDHVRRVDTANQRRMIDKLPGPVRFAVGAGTAVADPVVGLSQITGIGSDDWRERQLAAIESAKATKTGKAGAFAGNVAMYAAPATKLASAPKAIQYAGNMGIGALAGALDPVNEEGESRLKNTALGAGLGLAGQAASDALMVSGKAAANAVTPEIRALYKAAQAKGIKLTPAQLSDSKFVAYLRKQLGALPGSGAASHAAGQREAFNRAVSSTVGEAEPMSREVFDSALTRLGGEFDTFTNRPLPVTNGFMRNVLKVQDEAAAIGDADSARNMKAMADRIFKAGSSGRLDGRAVQSIDSQLSKLQAAGGERAYYASQMREALHSQLEKNMPHADFEAWKQTRKQYANLMKVTGLVAKDGEVSPGKLMGAVTANKAGKRAMARNRGGDLGELARIGQMMKLPPTSGTAEGAQAAGVGLGMLANPLKTVAGLTAGRGVRAMSDSDWLAQFLMSQSRGAGRQAIAPYVPAAGLGVMRYERDDNTGGRP